MIIDQDEQSVLIKIQTVCHSDGTPDSVIRKGALKKYIVTYRIRRGLHYCRHHRLKGVNCLNIFEYYIFIRMFLLHAGDIELNSGHESHSQPCLCPHGRVVSQLFITVCTSNII